MVNNSNFSKKVYSIVAQIPKGFVSTYGFVAGLAGNPRASRAVGNILHNNPDPRNIPCHRVVNHKGKLATFFAFGGYELQRFLLEKENITVVNNRVDIKKYVWSGEKIKNYRS